MLERLQRLLPNITFSEAESFYWSPAAQTVYYIAADIECSPGSWALLHEAAHAKFNHKTYATDLELLMLEVAAWDEACRIGELLNIRIDSEHTQDCLDTYRDWLHQRSTCPACGVVSLQENSNLYRCFNCLTSWHVSTSRFCRPYRLSKYSSENKTPPGKTMSQATFHKTV